MEPELFGYSQAHDKYWQRKWKENMQEYNKKIWNKINKNGNRKKKVR